MAHGRQEDDHIIESVVDAMDQARPSKIISLCNCTATAHVEKLLGLLGLHTPCADHRNAPVGLIRIRWISTSRVARSAPGQPPVS